MAQFLLPVVRAAHLRTPSPKIFPPSSWLIFPRHTSSKTHDIRVIVCACKAGNFLIPTHCRTDAFHFIAYHGFSVAAAANNDSEHPLPSIPSLMEGRKGKHFFTSFADNRRVIIVLLNMWRNICHINFF